MGYDRNYIKENSIHLLKALKGTRSYTRRGRRVRANGGEEWEVREMAGPAVLDVWRERWGKRERAQVAPHNEDEIYGNT